MNIVAIDHVVWSSKHGVRSPEPRQRTKVKCKQSKDTL